MKKDLRPTSLEEYIGQDGIKEILSVSMEAAKARKEPLDHVLLNGPPGLGKTTLAGIIAHQMGYTMFSYIGAQLDRSISRTIYLLEAKKAIIFIDEIHRTRQLVQEVLYPILEDRKTPMGLVIPYQFTVIGATTAIGKLEQPFIDRFGLQFQLQYYTDGELTRIVLNSAKTLGFSILDIDGAHEIAIRSRGTPRIANNFLKRIRDFAQVKKLTSIEPAWVTSILWDKLHVDEMGLQPLDRQYLGLLEFRPGGMGVEGMAAALKHDVETVEGYIEPFLVTRGLVERERNGRFITPEGVQWINKVRS